MRLWHKLAEYRFPTPEIKLLVLTNKNEILWAVRPNYASSYKDDPNFRDKHNNQIKGVLEWTIL